MINVLYQSLPETVTVDGRDYFVITDFREWIKFHDLFESDLSDIEKFTLALEWYTDEVPEDKTEAIKQLGKFLAAYELYEDDDPGIDENQSSTRPQAFSFSQDAGDIYSAFMQYYNIDLQNVGYMHWYKFRALFDALPGDCEIKQKMYYRTVDISKIKDKAERKRIREIREKIKIISRKKPKYVDDFVIGDVFG